MTYRTISRSIQVKASADTVFDAITNWSEQSKWMLGTSVKAGKQHGKGVGGTILARTSFGPFGFNDPMIITEWHPPYSCVILHTGKIVKGSGAFTVKPLSPSRAAFTWSEDVKIPFGFIGVIGWQAAKVPVMFTIRWSLGRFKKWVEAK